MYVEVGLVGLNMKEMYVEIGLVGLNMKGRETIFLAGSEPWGPKVGIPFLGAVSLLFKRAIFNFLNYVLCVWVYAR